MNISFIVPVYNCKRYLPACIDSILVVGMSDFEIILVDDGSTDGSGALCDALSQKHTQIRAVHQPNGGVSAARNRGIREAQGKYILFADADDTFDSDALWLVLSDPRCTQSDMTIFGMFFDYYYHGKCYRSDTLFHEFDDVLSKKHWGESFPQLYLDNSLSPLWNKVFRRELLEKLELNTDMFLYEDLEFVLRYMQHCETIFNVPKAIYHYRQPEDEGNAGRRLKRIDSISVFLQPIEAALDGLCVANPGLSKSDADSVLLQLHLTLAREKISVSGLSDIRRICQSFTQWYREKNMRPPEGHETFFIRLLSEKAGSLWLASKKIALRHKIAVWVKGNGIYKRGG